MTADAVSRARFVKVAARTALGLVWILEGLGPKILDVSPNEIDLVRRSGLFVGAPEQTIAALGVLEILAGVWLLTGIAERWAAATVTVVMAVLVAVVVANDPGALTNQYGGITKNLGLVGCAVAVWVLSPVTRPGSGEPS